MGKPEGRLDLARKLYLRAEADRKTAKRISILRRLPVVRCRAGVTGRASDFSKTETSALPNMDAIR
jgi:hypothetical protein